MYMPRRVQVYGNTTHYLLHKVQPLAKVQGNYCCVNFRVHQSVCGKHTVSSQMLIDGAYLLVQPNSMNAGSLLTHELILLGDGQSMLAFNWEAEAADLCEFKAKLVYM